MRRVVALVALVVVLLNAAPVAARQSTLVINFTDLVARVWDGNHRGLVLYDLIDHDNDTGRVTWALHGLTANATYRIVLTSVGCAADPIESDVIFVALAAAGGAGNSFGSFSGTANGSWRGPNSLRVWRVGGGEWECTTVARFHTPDQQTSAQAGYARFAGSDPLTGLVYVRQRPAGGTRVTVALKGFHAGDDYAVRGSTATCGAAGGTRLFGLRINNVASSVFATAVFDDSNMVHALSSARAKNLDGAQGNDCAAFHDLEEVQIPTF